MALRKTWRCVARSRWPPSTTGWKRLLPQSARLCSIRRRELHSASLNPPTAWIEGRGLKGRGLHYVAASSGISPFP